MNVIMYELIIFLPLIAFLTISFFEKYFDKIFSSIVTTGFVFLSFLISVIAFYEVAVCKTVKVIKLGVWFNIPPFVVNWGFIFDTLTVVMLIIITLISSLVHLYSIEYMKNDPNFSRFMSYLSLFTFFMLILVTGENFVVMFLGWEGVGVVSYLLISFWYTRIQASKSAIKAIIMNRVGDFGFIISMIVIYKLFHSLDFFVIFALVPFFWDSSLNFFGFDVSALNLITFFLFLGAVGKSAQLGLHIWLPDAMEGPTPVSALIHAATMVTAGIFVLVRCSPILEYSQKVLPIISIVGGLTAFFAAIVGVFQNDMKRIIAYSTCSQLGYMVFVCGMSQYSVAMFHLVNHAFFKALLFLGAGSIIHSLSDEQDIRRMGGLLNILPFTYSVMLVGSLSLAGFPFLTGFYSKDLIVEIAYASFTVSGTFVFWLSVMSAFFTSFYSIKLIYYSFISFPNCSKAIINNVHEAPILISIPLVVLSFGSIFVGYMLKDAFVGLGTDFWNNSIYVGVSNDTMFNSEFLPFYIKIIPVVFSFFGIIISFMFYSIYKYIRFNFYIIGYEIYKFLNKKWYFDILYNYFIAFPMLKFSYDVTFKLLDKGFVEYIGPYGISYAVNNLIIKLSRIQIGYIFSYIYFMIISLFFVFFFGIIIEFFNDSFIMSNFDDLVMVIIFCIFFYSDTGEDSSVDLQVIFFL